MAQIFNLIPLRNGFGSSRWSRGILLLGGACLAGTIAVVWFMRKKGNLPKSKLDAIRLKKPEPLKECTAGLEGSQEMKVRGNNLFQEMKYKEAVDAFSKAIGLCPANEKKHLAICFQNRAAARERVGSLDGTVEDCTSALLLNPYYHKAAIRRAKAYASLGKPEDALNDFMYAFVLDSTLTANYKTEIDKVVEDACEEVIKNLEKTRKSIPIRDEQVLLWRSCYVNDVVLHDLKTKFDLNSAYHKALQAIRDHRYEEVIPLIEADLDSGLTDAAESLRDFILIIRFALMKEDVTIMKKYLDKFARLWAALDEDAKNESSNRHYRATYYILCASLKLLTNPTLITEDIKRAIEVDENNVDIYLGASLLLSTNGQLPLAHEYLEQLATLDPKHHLVNHMKVNCELALKASIGDVVGTFNTMLKADELLKSNPDADPILHLITGRLYLAAQNLELAKASFQKAAESLSEYSAPIFYLAMVEAGENPDRMDILESKMKLCLEKEKANPDALAILAKLAFQRNEFREAQRLFERSISMWPLMSSKDAVRSSIIEFIRLRAICKALETLNSELSSSRFGEYQLFNSL